ncbi:MAG: DNA repair protein RecN (Recombination protein N) [Bacteroidetes bacterium]|nr:MAG: DNA repair protein RecN (Recombination protein N) [Bacteroidota bacterium]
MLLRLSIVNYALINRLDIEFGDRFSVITGETGAGKSIILGALSLMLGQRADNLSLPDKSVKCSIEGTFDLSECDLEGFFQENDLDYETICIIRREITPHGKSRAFINDTPVNLNQLKDLTGMLVDVHSQHQTLLLQESSFQLSVVDSVAGNALLLRRYKQLFREISTLKKELAMLVETNQKSRTELDYLNFLFDELEKASLKSGEQSELEGESEVLTHAEEIKTRLFQVSELLSHGEENVIRRLNEVVANLQVASRYQKESSELSTRVSACLIELRDIAASVERNAEEINYNPARIAEINDRLGLIYQLEQKHHVNSVDDLIAVRDSIEEKIATIDSLDLQIAGKEKQILALQQELTGFSGQLTEKRKAASGVIEKALLETVAQLGMIEAAFRVNITPLADPGRDGSDRIDFLFSANKGIPPAELSRIASGGELSRLMLAVKSLISSASLLPTIIFDEIDTGISGETATRVGSILKKIASNMQVIAITHLPQIAGKGNRHFKVFKFTDETRTYSAIEQLDDEQRITELALMISGDPDSKAARHAAAEMLQNNS